MAWQPTPYTVPMFVAGFVALGVAAYAWRQRPRAGSMSLTLLMLAIGEWGTSYGFELAYSGLVTKRLFTQLAYVGIAVVPVAWIYFVFEYTGRSEQLTDSTLASLFVIPVATILLAWTNPSHGLVWREVFLVEHATFTGLDVVYGPWFWVFSAYMYLLLAAGSYLLVQMYVLSDHVYRGQALALLASVAIAAATNLLYLAGVAPPGLDPTPVGAAAMGVVLAASVSRQDLLDSIPLAREVARDEVIETMDDAVVIVDEDRQTVDLNPAAADVFGVEPADAVGSQLSDLSSVLATSVEPSVDEDATSETVAIDTESGRRQYDVRVSTLYRGFGLLTGHLISLRDVTERHRRSQRLDVLNRTLRHDISNDANVILGNVELLLDREFDPDRARTIRRKTLDIIDLSRKVRQLERALERGEVARDELDAAEIVRDRVEAARATAEEARIEADLPPSAPVYANEMLDSAIDNVIENAIEHNDHDAPRVEVTVERRADLIAVVVADNGPGIPETERQVLLEGRETQLDHASGLGLWIVNWIVTESGGRVRLDTRDPRGSEVTLQFPAVDDRD